MKATAVPTEYTISCLPEDHEAYTAFMIQVQYRGDNKWAVTHFRNCIDKDGNMEWESLPSSRTDEFLQKYRHTLDEAIDIAKRVAPQIVVNGITVEEALQRHEQRKQQQTS